MYPNFIPQPYRRPINIALILGMLIVLYFIGKKLKIWDKPEVEGAEVKLDPKKEPPRAGFSAANEVSKLADLLSMTWDGGGEDLKAFNTILNYKDNEVTAVHNEWRKQHAGGNFWAGIKATLRQQINAETIWWYRKEAVEKKALVLKKLDRLNL